MVSWCGSELLDYIKSRAALIWIKKGRHHSPEELSLDKVRKYYFEESTASAKFKSLSRLKKKVRRKQEMFFNKQKKLTNTCSSRCYLKEERKLIAMCNIEFLTLKNLYFAARQDSCRSFPYLCHRLQTIFVDGTHFTLWQIIESIDLT